MDDEENSEEMTPGQKRAAHLPKGGHKGARKPSKLLATMRKVYKQDPAKDSPADALLAKCRAMFDRNPDKFIDRLDRMERSHRALADKSRPAAKVAAADPAPQTSATPQPLPASAPDAGSDRCLVLIDKLLATGASDGWT